MNSIYLHIPFCKKVCFYCDFHFTVSLKQKQPLIEALLKEIRLRKDYIGNNCVDTVYFGGGTPSILTPDELSQIFNEIHKHFTITDNSEITLEANPDDLNKSYLLGLKRMGVNRLSIGVQSFFDEDLKWMNRRHTAKIAEYSIKLSQDAGFHNLNIDLIYGIPSLTSNRWVRNLETFLKFGAPHLSAYHLTIEPKTVLGYQKRKGKLAEIAEENSLAQYEILTSTLKANKYQHYEISNFCKQEHYSIHNTNYWKGGNYLGIGPSAHSFNGKSRQWNVSVNSQYINAINNEEVFYESEILTGADNFNEYLLTGLRTIWGVDLKVVEKKYGEKYLEHLKKMVSGFINSDYVCISDTALRLTEKGMFVSDSIISELFLA